MADKRIAAQVDVSVTGTEKVDALAKKIDALDDTKIGISADTSDADRDVAKLIERVKKLSTEDAMVVLAVDAGQAQAELNDLLLDLRKFQGSDAEAEVKIANINQVRGDLDQLTAEIKRLDDTTATIDIDTTSAKQGMEDLGGAAESSKSVMANMVGNTSQDLAQLGGAAGTAGTAIGQMGEYMADAAFKGGSMSSILSSFGTMAVPLIAITAGVKEFTDTLARAAKVKAFRKEEVEDYTDALEGASDEIDAIKKKLESDKGLTANWFGKDEDLTPAFNAIGLGVDEVARLIAGGTPMIDAWGASMKAAGTDADAVAIITGILKDNVEDLTKAQEAHATTLDFLGTAREDEAAAQEAAMDRFKTAQEGVEEMIQHQKDQAEAVLEAGLAWDAAANMAESYANALDEINGASDVNFALQAFKTVESFDAVKGSLIELKGAAKDWKNVDLVPDSVEEFKGVSEEVKGVTEAIGGMRDSIQTELGNVLSTEGIDAYSDKFDFFANEVLAQFPQMFMDMGLSQEEAATKTQELMDELDLLPEDKEIQIKLTNEQQARAALDTFKGVIDTLPEDKKIAINTAIADGDIDAALAMLNSELVERGYPPIEIETNVLTAEGQGKVDSFISGNSGKTINVKVTPIFGPLPPNPYLKPTGTATATATMADEEMVGVTPFAAENVAGTSAWGMAIPVMAGQPIVNNTIVHIPTADPSAMVRALQRWTRSNGSLPVNRGRG